MMLKSPVCSTFLDRFDYAFQAPETDRKLQVGEFRFSKQLFSTTSVVCITKVGRNLNTVYNFRGSSYLVGVGYQ